MHAWAHLREAWVQIPGRNGRSPQETHSHEGDRQEKRRHNSIRELVLKTQPKSNAQAAGEARKFGMQHEGRGWERLLRREEPSDESKREGARQTGVGGGET